MIMKRKKELKVVYWRDIPAQVLLGKGRDAVKIKLSDKFEKAIDICAMKVNAKSAEEYLKYWRKSDPINYDDEDNKKVIYIQAEKIENEYSKEKLKYIIDNNGWINKKV